MSTGHLTDQDILSLRALTDAQVKAALAGDWTTFTATFSPDIVRMPPEQNPVEGREVVAAWQRGFPPIKSLANRIDAVDGDGTFAYMRGHNQITLELQGIPVELSFKWLAVYRKQGDGTWAMIADMWNANPGAAAQQ